MNRRSHKARPANFDSNVDRRDLARIQRLQHRKSIKEDVLNRNRNLDMENVAGPSGVGQPHQLENNENKDLKNRKMVLQRWKEQKALKLQLQKELEKAKPPFKLAGKIVYQTPAFLVSAMPSDKVLHPKNAAQPSGSGVMTRSRAAAMKTPQIPTKLGFAVPKGAIMKGKVAKAPKATPKRNVSFAPENHAFVAPVGIAGYHVATFSDNIIPQSTEEVVPMETEEAVAEPLTSTLNVSRSVEEGPELKVATPLMDRFVTMTRGSSSSKKWERERRAKLVRDDLPAKILVFQDELTNKEEIESESSETDIPESQLCQQAQAVGVTRASSGVVLSPAYFRGLVKTTTENLRLLSSKWNEIKDGDMNVPEDAIGQIMTTVGLTDILITSKFKQFSSLVDDCQNGSQKVVTVTDLQGFWEMVQYQVDDVRKKFDVLEQQYRNNWVVIEEVQVKTMKCLKKKKKVETAAGVRHASDARKRIAEMRAKARASKNTPTPRRSSARLRPKTKSSIATPDILMPIVNLENSQLDSKPLIEIQKNEENVPELPTLGNLSALLSPFTTTEERCLRSRSTNLMRFSEIMPQTGKENTNVTAPFPPLSILDED